MSPSEELSKYKEAITAIKIGMCVCVCLLGFFFYAESAFDSFHDWFSDGECPEHGCGCGVIAGLSIFFTYALFWLFLVYAYITKIIHRLVPRLLIEKLRGY